MSTHRPAQGLGGGITRGARFNRRHNRRAPMTNGQAPMTLGAAKPAVAPAEKHWLVKRAEEIPLGGVFDPAEMRITNMFCGAMQSAVKPLCGDPSEVTLEHIRKLVAAEEEAQQVIARRRAEAGSGLAAGSGLSAEVLPSV